MSESKKNQGRYFWVCPAQCDVFNGWVALEDYPMKRDEEDEYDDDDDDNDDAWLRCSRCQLETDLDFEVEYQAKQYSGVPRYALEEMVREDIEQDMRSGKFVCTDCVENDKE